TEFTIGKFNTTQERRDFDSMEALGMATIGGVAFPVAAQSLKLTFKTASKLFAGTEARLNAGKRPFGDQVELELLTEHKRTELSTELKQLEEAHRLDQEKLNAGDESVVEAMTERTRRLDEINDHLRTIDEGLSDHSGIKERANSDESSMYYDEAIASKL